MKFDAYEKMRASAVDWIDEVPSHWQERKITYGFRRIGSGTTPKSDNPAFYDDHGTPWVTTSELRETYITATKKYVTPDAIAAHSSLRVYPVESVLFAMYGATIGRLGMLGVPATVNQACCVFADPIDVHPRYVFYWLLMRREILVGLSSGGGQPNLSQDDLRQVRLQVPPPNEQELIADYLDRATGKIDLLVKKKRELLALLDEKRRALITRCVTRGLPPEAACSAGLNPHAKLKPSGIDWLGDIPEHWDIKKLSWLFIYRKGKNAASLTKEFIADNPGDFPVYSGQTANEGLMGFTDTFEFDFREPAILVTTVGARAMTTRLLCGKFSLSQNCALIVPVKNVCVPFFEHVLQPLFSYERGSISLIMQPSLRFEDLNRFRVPLPPPEEQIAIEKYITAKIVHMDRTSEKTHEAIDTLLEYRSALITAAVTGKLDLREVEE